MRRKKAKRAAPMINLEAANNEKAVQKILRDRSLTPAVKREALRALTRTLNVTITNCTFTE